MRDLAVLRAVETVPRHLFVPSTVAHLASRDLALPIACGQTATRPSLVARMLEALQCRAEDRVLEVGTGSGYATALLSILCASIHTVERFRTLSDGAAAVLRSLDLDQLTLEVADGLAASPGPGRFTRIVVHGVIEGPPPVLMERLEPDGVLVCGIRAPGEGGMARLARFRGEGVEPDIIAPCDLTPLTAGLPRAL